MRSLPLVLALYQLSQIADAALQLDFTSSRRSPAQSLRRRSLSRLGRRDSVSATLQNAQSDTLYLLNVTVGSPAQSMMLQLDTGSSDIWVPWSDSDICSGRDNPCTNGAYDPSKSDTFKDVGADAFDISYVDGTEIQGDYVTDNFGVGGITVENMTMGVAKDAKIQQDGVPFQGIVGVGFEAGESIADGDPSETYPNLISVLKAQGKTSSDAYSLWLNDLGKHTWTYPHFPSNRSQRPAQDQFSLEQSTTRSLMEIWSRCPSSPTKTLVHSRRLPWFWTTSMSSLALAPSNTPVVASPCRSSLIPARR